MNRAPHPGDFTFPVEGVGAFTFGRRGMLDQIAIERVYAELTGGLIPYASVFGELCSKIADLKVLTVKAPDGWSLDALDPMDESSYAKINAIWEGLREAELRFRGRLQADVPQAGEGAGGQP